MRSLAVASALAAIFTAAQAQSPAHLANVAGYKATFTCSATFLAGRTPEQIAEDELAGVYADYAEALAALPPAEIDREKGEVRVRYAADAPPRIAVYAGRAYGCLQAPAMAQDRTAIARLAAPRGGALNDERAWPDGDLTAGTFLADRPEGFNLAGVARDAFDGATYGAGSRTTAVLVLRDGEIAAERYREDFDKHTPQRTWSVAKSIAATILGAAARERLIAVDAPAGLAQWASGGDPRGAITIDDLLRMASGLDATPAGNRTDDVYFGGGRVVDHAATRRLAAAPGTAFVYANNDTMLAMRALREKMKDDRRFHRFAFEKVLFRIGMTRTSLETDWNGDFILSSQVWTTARDLARLGLLYLDDGVWNGERILPEGFVDYVRRAGPAQPPLNRPGYGAQFWLFGPRQGLPEGSYAAMGNRGQYLMIVPERRVVVVRRGFDGPGNAFDIEAFTRDVLVALAD